MGLIFEILWDVILVSLFWLYYCYIDLSIVRKLKFLLLVEMNYDFEMLLNIFSFFIRK